MHALTNDQKQQSITDDIAITYGVITSCESRYLGVRLILSNLAGPEQSAVAALDACAPFIKNIHGTVLVTLRHFSMGAALLEWQPPSNAVLTIPAIELIDDAQKIIVKNLFENNHIRLAVEGRSDVPLPPEMICMFECALIREDEDRRRKQDINESTTYRRMPFLTIEDPNQDSVEAAFFAGAMASIGLPRDFTVTPQAVNPSQPPQMAAIRLCKMVNEEVQEERMESALSLAPAVLARLLKMIALMVPHAPEIDSVSAAIAYFKHKGLLRFMILLLLTSSRDGKSLTIVHAALARAFMLQTISTLQMPEDKDESDAAFCAGALSLVDMITMTKHEKIFELTAMPSAIAEKVLTPDCAHKLRMALIEAIEKNDAKTVFTSINTMGLSFQAVNAALFTALHNAQAIVEAMSA